MTEIPSFTQLQDLSVAFARLVGIAAPGIVAVQSHRSRSSGFFAGWDLHLLESAALSRRTPTTTSGLLARLDPPGTISSLERSADDISRFR
jgi:hypothetical protein